MTYSVYLFVSLLKEYDDEFASRPIQEQFDLSKYLYKEFEKSEFYDKSQEDDLETCIIEYLENKYNRVDLDLDTEIDDDY
jgi:hypothetical protein